MKRVAYVCADPGVPAFGYKGCSVHVQEMIRALRGLGVEVELFAPNLGDHTPSDLETVCTHRLPAPHGDDRSAREHAALAANRSTTGALQREGPFDLVYERYSLWSFAGMEYASTNGTPGLLEVNAPLIEEQAEHRGLVDRVAAEGVAERAFGAATALLAVSSEIAAYLGRYPGARGRVYVVPNGVDPDRFPSGFTPSLPRLPETFTVGFVGTLKPWHGLPNLVDAFATLHREDASTRLLVVGDGPERASLEVDLRDRGLAAAAHLTGAVAPEEIPGLLASMDVATAPYPGQPHFYFSPLKVYEYMAAGLPVVASRIGQLAELIRDEMNGLLCPPGDTLALVGALHRLRREPNLRTRLGQGARATVLRDHTWDAVARRVLALAGLASATQTRLAEVRG